MAGYPYMTGLGGSGLSGGSGALAGINPAVKLLQDELGKLAEASGNFDVSPGRTDGTMSLGTIIALSHAAGVVGAGIHPTLRKALDLVADIKKPLEKIPYAGPVISLILSPWIVDSVFNTILAIMRIIPGAGDAAAATKKAVEAFELLLAGAALPLAGALALARKTVVKAPPTSSGLGSSGGFDFDGAGDFWRRPSGPLFYDPVRHGPLLGSLCDAANITVAVSATPCAGGQYRNAAGVCVTIPSCPPGQRYNTVIQRCGVITMAEHAAWPTGKAIVPGQWSKTLQYRGKCTLADLAPADRQAFDASAARYATQYPITGDVGAQIQVYLRRGIVVFREFTGADGSRMGAFIDLDKGQLTIRPLPPKKSGGSSLWGRIKSAVGNAIDYTSDALSDAANATGEFLSDCWDAVDDTVIEIYETIKEYGCAIVGSDLCVAIAAGGAGLVATPAASAAVVAGAGAGRAGCAILEVGELIIAILRLLSTDFPPPPGVSNEMRQVTGILNLQKPVMGRLFLPIGGLVRAYPKGSIARFNTTRHVWVVYAPAVSLGAVGVGSAHVAVPPPPAGFVAVGEEPAAPAGVTAVGEERDWRWYDSRVLWAGLGVTTVGLVGYRVYRKRHR